MNRIVEAVGFTTGETVYEVGPGLGTLTRALALAGAKVVTVEMDRRLEAVHAETLAGLDVQVIWGDALEFDWVSVPSQSLFAGNLPYNIATPLITKMLLAGRFKRMVVLVQKEVALRMTAQPDTSEYGILSLRVQHHAKAKRIVDLPPGVFLPAPKVTSSVVLLEPIFTDGQAVPDDPALFKLIESAFSQRRKTLSNALKSKGYNPEQVVQALSHLQLNPLVRGETLSLTQFVALHRLLSP